MKMTCQHKLSATLLLLMMASSSCGALFVASSLRWGKTPSSTSPCSFCHHHQLPHRRRRCHDLSAVGSDDAPPQYSSISHDHKYNSRERAAKFVRKNGRDKNELMMGGIVRGVVASLVSTLVVSMGYLPMLLPLDGVQYFNDGSSYINNDMRKNDNMLRVHFGVGTAFALDTIDDSGRSVTKTTTTTAFSRGYPRTDTSIENNAEERVQLDNPIRSVVSQSTTSALDLKVVMNENQSTQANLGADVEQSPPSKPAVSPLPKDTTTKLESRMQQRVDPSLQAIVNKALTPDSMIAKGALKASMYSTAKYDGVEGKPNSNALTTTVGKQTTSIVSRENCDESPHSSFVDVLSGVFNNAIIFSFGVGVGIVSFITREKMSVGVADTSSHAMTIQSLPNENDKGETANAIATFGGLSSSYIDGLSGAQPLEFTDQGR